MTNVFQYLVDHMWISMVAVQLIILCATGGRGWLHIPRDWSHKYDGLETNWRGRMNHCNCRVVTQTQWGRFCDRHSDKHTHSDTNAV